MANSNSVQPAADQNRESYADDAKARRVLVVDDSGNVVTTWIVTATDLDIRDLTSASDSVEVLQNTHADLKGTMIISDGTDNADVVTAADDDTNLDATNGVVVNSITSARIDADTVKPLRMDGATHTLQTIEYEHHEIHAGSHYFICDNTTLGNGANIDLTIQTPDTTKWSHITFKATGSQSILFEIYEASNYDADGTLFTPLNNDRNSANTSGNTLRTNPTVNSDGTKIYSSLVGANRVAGFVDRSREIILKQNTKYIFRITNQEATNTDVSWCGDWYEHTNKD